MDFEKTKTQLIILFVLLNIFLLYTLVTRREQKGDNFDVNSILKKYGIENYADIPENISAKKIRMEFVIPDVDDIAKVFFDDPVIKSDELITEISEGFESLSIINRKLLRYKNTPEKRDRKIKTLDEARNIAIDFLKKRYLYDNLVLNYEEYKYNNFTFSFGLKDPNSGLFLERAYTNISLNEDGVIFMERTSFLIPTPQKEEISIEDPKRLLLKLINYKEASGRQIVEILPCYSFNTSKSPYLVYENAEGGNARLGLRVRFKDGLIIVLE